MTSSARSSGLSPPILSDSHERPANHRRMWRATVRQMVSPSRVLFPAARTAMTRSRGERIVRRSAPASVERLLDQLDAMGAPPVVIHRDQAARLASAAAGAHAFTIGSHVFIGPTVDTPVGPGLAEVLRHELVHVAQAHRGRMTGRFAGAAKVEREAHRLADHPAADLVGVIGADPDAIHRLWWLLPLGAAVYTLLRPNVANAPKPGDRTQRSVSELEVAGEAFALFAVPTGAYALGGRLSLGFYGSSALAGGAANVALRGVHDAGSGQLSGAGVYVFDGLTGAVVSVVVPGGIRLIGRAGTASLDWLATQGMRRSDLLITNAIIDKAARSATGSVSRGELEALLVPQGISGRMADWWLTRRGLVLLYRGQAHPTAQLLSPMAREQGVGASQKLVERMRAAGLTNDEIALYTAKYYNNPVPAFDTLPGLGVNLSVPPASRRRASRASPPTSVARASCTSSARQRAKLSRCSPGAWPSRTNGCS